MVQPPEGTLGSTHPKVAERLAQVGRLLGRQSHPEEALPLLERAHAIWEQTVPDHPEALIRREALTDLLRRLGRDDKAVLLETHAQTNGTEPQAAS